MTAAPPNWYPDPTSPHQLRYWDGSQWTAHVAPAHAMGPGPATTAPPGKKRRGTRHLGWVGALLCVAAVVAVAVPGVGFVRTSTEDGVRLDGSAQHVRLPAHEKYGIYVDDADNSGYSESCTAVDRDGREIHLDDSSWSMSSSETEMLDYVFDTGSGDLTITCSVPGERVTARPVPNFGALALGVVGGGILGLAGVVMLIVWLVTRNQRRQPR
jgi:hypothetical protein